MFLAKIWEQMNDSDVQNSIANALSGNTSEETEQSFVDSQAMISKGLEAIAQNKETQHTLSSSEASEDSTPATEAEPTADTTESTEDVVEDEGEDEVVESDDDTPADTEDEVVTSDDDSEEAQEDEEDDEFFHVGEFSQYKTRDDAKKGIDHKDRFINELKESQEALTARLNELEQVNALYSGHLTEDDIRESLVRAKLPEEFVGRTASDFEDDDLKRFLESRAKAEVVVERELADAKKQLIDQQESQKEAQAKAREWVQANATPDYFGVKNPEDLKSLYDKLNAKDDSGYNLREKVSLIVEVFGEEAGSVFLKGVREEFGGSASTSTPKPKKPAKAKATKDKVVEKVTRSQAVVKPVPKPAPDPTIDTRSAKDKIAAALSNL